MCCARNFSFGFGGSGIIAFLPVEVPLFIPAADGFPLVVFLFPAGQAQLHFGLPAPEIDFQRNQGHSLFIDFPQQALDFEPAQKEFANAQRIMVVVMGVGIGADVHLVEEYFSVFDSRIGIFDIGPTHLQGLDLGAPKDHARFDFLVDEIIEAGLPVVRDDFDVVVAQGLVLQDLQKSDSQPVASGLLLLVEKLPVGVDQQFFDFHRGRHFHGFFYQLPGVGNR